MKRIFIRITSIALVALMLILAASCDSAIVNDNSENKATEPQMIEVPIFTSDIEFAKKITPDKVTTKKIYVDALSATMITKVEDVVGKYAAVALYAGDFAYTGKVSRKKPVQQLDASEVEKTRNKYIDVSQFVEPNSGIDVHAALQEIIDNNKHKTLYFPDGEYIISKPLKTSAAAASSTAFYLSDNAIIKASDNWNDSDGALIELGGAEVANDITTPGSNYHFIGGILDGNSKARGISLASGRESLVSKVKIINATVGIYIPEGVNSKSSDMDIEDIDIIGFGATSKGIVSIGLDNTFTDIRISNVKVGVENSGGSFFRGISVRLDKNQPYEGTVAFVTSGVSWFYSCTSENMQTAFQFSGGYSGSAPVVKDFSIRWTEAKGAQTAFDIKGNFVSTCSNGVIDFFDASTENSILKVSGQNNGKLLDVLADTELCDESTYKSVFISSNVD
jgi:hypothetical protein